MIEEGEKIDLEPCPLCASDQMINGYEGDFYYIQCGQCGIKLSRYQYLPINEWNTRVNPAHAGDDTALGKDTHPSASSAPFESTVDAVDEIIRNSGPDLIAGRSRIVAALIAARLAR